MRDLESPAPLPLRSTTSPSLLTMNFAAKFQETSPEFVCSLRKFHTGLASAPLTSTLAIMFTPGSPWAKPLSAANFLISASVPGS